MKLPDLEKILGDPKAEAAFLGLAILYASVYRGWGTLMTLMGGVPDISHISYDGVYFAQIARNILAGDGLGWEAMLFPVLQPILIAAISFVTGLHNLAFLSSYVSQTAGMLRIIPLYLLARELYGRKAAVAAVLIAIPYPHLVAISSSDTSESLYCLLTLLSVYLGYKAMSGGGRGFLFLTGITLGLTYLARPEGLVLFSVFMLLAAWRLIKILPGKDAVRGLAALTAGFMLFALPYAVFLSKSYGRLMLSCKLPYESVAMKSKSLGEPQSFQDVEGLTENGEIVWREKGGKDLVFGYFKKDPAKFIRVYLNNLRSELPWEVDNSTHLAGYPVVYPVYLWLLALLGFAVMFRARESRWKAVLLWLPFSNLFVYPVFTQGFWIYHVPYVPLLVVLAVGGLLYVSARLKGRYKVAVPVLLAFVTVWTAYTMHIRSASQPEKNKTISAKTVVSQESMRVGQWARGYFGTDVTYMMLWSRTVYYLGGRWVEMPMDRAGRVVEYGKRHGVDYVVEEFMGNDVKMGSMFKGIPSMEILYVYESPVAPYRVMFWRLKKEAGPSTGP
jgi:4-amino-4-deoxy-L-arabinose transferase-like glycosyltransferase